MSANDPRTSAAKRRCIFVDRTSYGSPPENEPLDVQSVQVKIYDFENLQKQRSKCIVTGNLRAHGHTWKVQVYPRGDSQSNETTENVSVYLHCVDAIGDKNVKTKYTISSGTLSRESPVNDFSSKDNVWGWKDFAKRVDVLSKCLNEDGSLEINIGIQVYGKSRVWYPKQAEGAPYPLGSRLLESSVESDVTFVVGEEQGKFHGHKNILSLQAPLLHELVQNSQAGVEIAIPNVSRRVFKILLEHVYTGILPKLDDIVADDDDDDGIDFAKSILLGADRFGLTMLKLHIESECISKFLTATNVADWLLVADGHSCPLLKEACMDNCTDNLSGIKASSGWKNVKESPDLLEELLDYYANGKQSPKDSKDYDNMSVRKLREELENRDLELDGTKAMLIQRLKDNDSAV